MNINIKLNDINAKVPTRGSSQAAGWDLYATTDVVIWPHETTKVDTGIIAEIPEGYFGAIFARSGLATKHGLRPANCVGVVDSDYRGNIIVALHNDTEVRKSVNAGDRIAQLVIMPYLPVEFNVVDELTDTERGKGGFGSTDK